MQLASSTIKKCTLELGGKSPEHRATRTRTSTRRSTARCGPPSSTRARCASRARACWCPSRSTTTSWSGWWSAPSGSRSATRWTTTPTWDRWCPPSSSRPCRTTCASARRRARSSCWAASAPDDAPEGGHYFEPTIFTDVDNSMTIAQEEIFGPVLSVIKFKDDKDAIRIANDSIYGLGVRGVVRGLRPLPGDREEAARGHGVDQRPPPDQLHRPVRRLQADRDSGASSAPTGSTSTPRSSTCTWTSRAIPSARCSACSCRSRPSRDGGDGARVGRAPGAPRPSL